jgi:hypothetical protein
MNKKEVGSDNNCLVLIYNIHFFSTIEETMGNLIHSQLRLGYDAGTLHLTKPLNWFNSYLPILKEL